ncbi:hypothetical protein [Rhodospirillaceae bacterium SYSU D60014]|uniref:hypothetical protein n=1 Tax=Virgifigura deserti TaxID=2268457 RepID=UPI000E67505A
MSRGSKPGERRGGRKPGTPNKATFASRTRIEQEADPIGFLTRIMRGEPVETAPTKDADQQVKAYPTTDQRIAAAKILADKLVPNAKDRPIELPLLGIKTPDDVLAAISTALQAMGEGTITPAEASTVIGALELKRRAIETVEIERRLGELERTGSGP